MYRAGGGGGSSSQEATPDRPQPSSLAPRLSSGWTAANVRPSADGGGDNSAKRRRLEGGADADADAAATDADASFASPYGLAAVEDNASGAALRLAAAALAVEGRGGHSSSPGSATALSSQQTAKSQAAETRDEHEAEERQEQQQHHQQQRGAGQTSNGTAREETTAKARDDEETLRDGPRQPVRVQRERRGGGLLELGRRRRCSFEPPAGRVAHAHDAETARKLESVVATRPSGGLLVIF